MNLPPFVPIEEQMPNWPDVRIHMLSVLPQRFEMRFYPLNTMAVDYDWVEDLIAASPLDFTTQSILRLRLLDLSRAIIPLMRIANIDDAVGMPMTPDTLARVNLAIADVDRKLRDVHEPTIMEVARHILGLEPAPNHTHRTIN